MQTLATEQGSPIIEFLAVEARADGLALTWNDGHSSFFHHIWLRDCCYCADCGDSYSSKRYVVPCDIPLDVAAASADLTPTGELRIVWRHDGHESRYAPDWLRAHCYDDASRAARFHRPRLWDAHSAEPVPLSWADLQAEDKNRLAFFRRLRDFGYVIVRGGPAQPGGIEAVANLIGDLGDTAYTKIFDLSPSSAINTMGNTFRAVPPHTDEAFRYAPPGINLLGCVRPAAEGGESILVDGFFIAERLRAEHPAMFDLLSHYQQSFNRIHPGSLDQRSRQRIILLDDRGEVIGIRLHTRSAGPMDLPPALVEPFYAAYRKLCEYMMAAENQLEFQLQAGDCVLFDNSRVLHSRTEFSDPRRFLQLCNIDREAFHERLRLLADKLGHADEARMVLAAGLS